MGCFWIVGVMDLGFGVGWVYCVIWFGLFGLLLRVVLVVDLVLCVRGVAVWFCFAAGVWVWAI